MKTAPDAFRHANAYARHLGWAVFPVRQDKAPLTPHGVKDATTDAAKLAAWWRRWPSAGVAIATGEASALVLDVDPRHGGDETLFELQREHGELPETPRVETGGGGEHHYFQPLAGIGNSAGALGVGLDVKSLGGYVIAPPTIHASGRPYAWDVSPREQPLAEVPEWLRARLSVSETDGPKARAPEWWQSIAAGVREGGRNQAVASLYGHLLRCGFDPVAGRALLIGWDQGANLPPLGRVEVERVCESIATRELARKVADRG